MMSKIIEFMAEFLSANTAGVTNFMGIECLTNLEWIFGVVPVCALLPAIFTIIMIEDSPEEFPTFRKALNWALTYEPKKK